MSISQKHPGKVLFPWFNLTEWESICNLIYNESSRDLAKAVSILRMWKIRTPLLSAGVEGTLIILEALEARKDVLSTYELSHIYATSLVRFLNLCAAHGDKQGTFYKMARKSGLPKWIVSLRHDIAHSHKIPSLAMLELSLTFGLEWLKDKYWNAQEHMSDFVVIKDGEKVIEDCVYMYLHMKEIEPKRRGYRNKKLRDYIKKYVRNNRKLTRDEVLDNIVGILTTCLKGNPHSGDLIMKLVLPKVQHCSGDPEELTEKWGGLLDVLDEVDLLTQFISGLIDLVGNEEQSDHSRHVASLYIPEIIRKFQPDLSDGDFLLRTVQTPTPFTLNFVTEVADASAVSGQFRDDVIELITAFNSQTNGESDRVYTVEDLGICTGPEDETLASSSGKWTRINNTSSFDKLPPGVLPHQDISVNPLLRF